MLSLFSTVFAGAKAFLNYIYLGVAIVLIAVIVYYKIKLGSAQTNLAKAQTSIVHLTDAIEAYKLLGQQQDKDAQEATKTAAKEAQIGAALVLKTMDTPESVVTRAWALRQIQEMQK